INAKYTFSQADCRTIVMLQFFTMKPSIVFFTMLRPLPRSTLFPYTTLFRSRHRLILPAPIDGRRRLRDRPGVTLEGFAKARIDRSEEHTSELQSQSNFVCRLLLEKKNQGFRNSHNRRRNLGREFLLTVTHQDDHCLSG